MGNTNDNRFGKNNPFFGKHHNTETRLKISEKMSNGNHHQAKKIGDNTGRIWNTVKECAEELDINKNHLSSMLLGKEKFPNRIKDLNLQYLD
jgi:hypothetical protein